MSANDDVPFSNDFSDTSSEDENDDLLQGMQNLTYSDNESDSPLHQEKERITNLKRRVENLKNEISNKKPRINRKRAGDNEEMGGASKRRASPASESDSESEDESNRPGKRAAEDELPYRPKKARAENANDVGSNLLKRQNDQLKYLFNDIDRNEKRQKTNNSEGGGGFFSNLFGGGSGSQEGESDSESDSDMEDRDADDYMPKRVRL